MAKKKDEDYLIYGPEDEEMSVKPDHGAQTKRPLPDGQVRVEFLDGSFKGKTRLMSRGQASHLKVSGRIKILDG